MKKTFFALVASLALALSARADLSLSFHSHVIDVSDGLGLNVGDSITTTYFLPGLPEDINGDGSVLNWENATATVESSGNVLFTSDFSTATFETLGVANGFQSFALGEGFLAESFLSSDINVMDAGFLKPMVDPASFDVSFTGFLSLDAGTIDWTIDTYSVSAVPEPSTYGLLGAGVLLVGAMIRRRRRA
jgi:PEP-CTERM motif-containing protein